MMKSINLPKSFCGYALEFVACILNMVSSKKVGKTPYEIWNRKAPNLLPKGNNGILLLQPTREQDFFTRYAEFFENNLNLQEAKEDTQPSNDTSERHNEVEPSEVEPHIMEVPIRKPGRISQATNRYGFYVDTEEHELGDLNEPTNYKAALLDHESDK
ncbi:hypothetical protein Tco_0776181 [Tanacetum coccineum]